MLYLNIVCLLLYAAIYMFSIKGTKGWEKEIDKKEHRFYFLYPMADFILNKTWLYRLLHRRQKVTDSIKALNVAAKTEAIQMLYWCSKVSLIIIILIIFHTFSLLVELQSISNAKILDGRYLLRPETGEESEKVDLKVTMDRMNEENNIDKGNADIFSEDITVDIKERSYTEKELKDIFEKAVQYLNISILGSNESEENIYDNLYFCEFIPGTGISVKWQPKDRNLIGMDGRVNNEEIDAEGVLTSVSAVLSYQDVQVNYKKQLKIMTKKTSEEEKLRLMLEEEVDNSLERTKEDKMAELPDSVSGYRLHWKASEQNISVKILLLGFLAAALTWFYGDQDLSQKMKKRKEQMMLDYPEIIHKFTLLVNAGMTVKQAWIKITQDYEKNRTDRHHKKRYAYEEMLVTVHELMLGVAENDAYEQFGRRIGLFSYIKFGSLIAQNLKKGNKGLSELLTREATEAFEERKETAKRLGEEAATKLLAPMMVMLLIVFAVILIPAFISFNI